ncbi:MAG: transcription antitermination factor NusB [Candidatus Delongbacteria bacterium]|nr:transcription antitermination factor NusB [Candidatus Delongbacteria bacterium]MBN2833965.1 transcription antitermination factor NusB [Candidatus Delongbacteria bacterium]
MISRRKTREVLLSILFTMENCELDVEKILGDVMNYWRWFEESCNETVWDHVVDTLNSAYDDIVLEKSSKDDVVIIPIIGSDDEVSISLTELINERKKDQFMNLADNISEKYEKEQVKLPTDFDKDEMIRIEENIQYLRNFLEIYEKNKDVVDEDILKRLDNWDFGRLTLMDKLLLRLGVIEIRYVPEIPPKVTINEVIDISKRFSTPKSGTFINGILNNLLHDINNENSSNI